jgi:hypothetical protein
MIKKRRRLLFVLVMLGTATVLACGPFFPEDALDQPRGILRPPVFHFQSELSRVPLPDGISRHPAGTPAYTLDLEMMEMEDIMSGRMPDKAAREAWMSRYRMLRRAMIHAGDDSEQKMQKADTDAVVPWAKAKADLPAMAAVLPEDVKLYLEGAAIWLDAVSNTDETAKLKARGSWLNLLKLPEDQRRWRSTWAAWMLFRSSPRTEEGRWLKEVRRLHLAGFKDCLHLGIEATYILGRANSDYPERTEVSAVEWKRASMLRARLGLNHAEENLRQDRWLLTEWGGDFARQVIADPLLRRVQLLHLIEVAQSAAGEEIGLQRESSPPDSLTKWLTSMEEASIKDQKEALWLAWALYNAAKYEQARRWLGLAPADDVDALSLRGKLAAMRGDRREAESQLKRMAALLQPADDRKKSAEELSVRDEANPLSAQNYAQIRRHKLLGDLGVVQLSRNDFAGALQTFLRTEYWRDAAYIAERLLSVEELLSLSRAGRLPELKPMFVPDKEPPRRLSISAVTAKYAQWERPQGLEPFTYLVARRLAREGYYKDAMRLLPADLSAVLNRYMTELHRGRKTSLPQADRAEALWTAAQIERRLGMELFGYETGPDHALYGGSFELSDFAELRSQPFWTPWWWTPSKTEQANELERPVLTATTDELWRSKHYGPRINERFHYRYTAAELAHRASLLMPDEDEKTAMVLGIAGNWLKNRDPKAADRFYKSLVLRNPSIPLAQKAERKRWLPPIDWQFDLELETPGLAH